MLFAAPAHAARAPFLTRAISDGGAFSTAGSARLMDVSLQRGARASAQVARLPLNWALVQARRTPVDPTNPADPAYDFAETDALVRAAVRHGLTPLLRVGGAPAAHEAQPRWRFAAYGTWAPDPAAYGRFAIAVARRYSGHFHDLPRVLLYQAWNEPNLARFLQPQWIGIDGEWVAYSAPHYRRLLNAFYDGVKGVDRRNVVATAGTAPNGDPDGRGRMKPLRFWRSFLCLDAPCADPPRFDVLAHHPLSVTNPDIPARDPGNVGIADFHALKALLPAGKRLWVTEINWDSGTKGATAEQLQRWVPDALYRLWSEGVDMVTWQFVRDPPSRPEHPGGLYAIDPAAPLDPLRDRPKRAAIQAFRFPFTGTRTDRAHLRLWALTPRAERTRVAVQRRRGGRWVTVRHLTANRHGLVRAEITLRGRARLRLATVRQGASGTWDAPTG